MSNYFSVGDGGKLRFNQGDLSEEIDDFKIEFQGTFDIAASVYNVADTDLDKLYEHTERVDKSITVTRERAYQIDISRNKRVKIARFIKCGSLIKSSKPSVHEDLTRAEIEIDLQSIAEWQKQTRIYFSNQLAD